MSPPPSLKPRNARRLRSRVRQIVVGVLVVYGVYLLAGLVLVHGIPGG